MAVHDHVEAVHPAARQAHRQVGRRRGTRGRGRRGAGGQGAQVVSVSFGDPMPPEPISGIVSMLALDERPRGGLTEGVVATIELVRGLEVTAPIWFVTQGAVSAGRI